MQDIRLLFRPASVAVIGASANLGKLGNTVLNNLLVGGYGGKVYPVNQSVAEIGGLPVFKDIRDITGSVDVAVIVIPAPGVLEAVKGCADKGVRFAIIITSGFSEIGKVEEENRIIDYAHGHDMRILGPNVIGLYSAAGSMNATFGPPDIPAGNVAIVTQSGALGVGMIGKARVENIGLSTIISLGNKSDLDEVDVLEYLADDERTRAIMMYMEGVTHGERLVQLMRRVAQIKPVVVLKSGRSKRGALAAASHTGSLAGEDKVFDDVARQCGVLRAEGLQEALDWCKVLAASVEPLGENTVIITNGGGIGVMTADACDKYGINLYDNVADLKNTFASVVPEFGSTKNPVDMTGQARSDEYIAALDAAMKSTGVNSVICLGCEAGGFAPDKFALQAEQMLTSEKINKPVVFAFVGGAGVESTVRMLRGRGVPIYTDVLQAASCLGAIYSHYRQKRLPAPVFEQPKIDEDSIGDILANAASEGRRLLYSYEAQQIMRAVGVPGPVTTMVSTLEEAVASAEKLGYPVVMKIVSRDIVHKSDVGGVALDINTRDEAADAYEAIMHSCHRFLPDARLEGVEVSQQADAGLETIAGARRDISFGPVVMFGLGGVYVEVMKDIAFRSFPLGRSEAARMISEIKSYPLLLGVRGEKRKDIDSVTEVILRIGTVLSRFPLITDIEINPLIAYEYGKGASAVDVRILLSA